MTRRFRNRRDLFSRGYIAEGVLLFMTLFMFLYYPQTTGAVSEVEMTGFRITQETESGQWEIKAGKAHYNGQGDVVLMEVSARMVADGVERVTVVSDQGRYDSEGLILHLEGNVVVASGLGTQFETPRLKWDGPGAVMLAEDGVKLRRDGLEIKGQSVRYTVNNGTAIVDGHVQTTWNERRSLR